MGIHENHAENYRREFARKTRVVDVATGRVPADLVLKNASYVNAFSNSICTGDIAVAEGLFVGIGDYHGKTEIDASDKLVLPGFMDAHIHLESAIVPPSEFAKAVLPHGTTTVVADPHEIANVMGTDGIQYMLEATEGLPVDVKFMLPSCVPATAMDESGANLDRAAIEPFYENERVLGLAEMMNYVGVANAAPEVLEKLVSAQAHKKCIDGHAPSLSGNALNGYIAAGVYSDHECSDPADAIAKLERGQYIMIREGTAARNLEALIPLLKPQYADRCLFCCDDKHPSELLHNGHIDDIVRTAIARGVDPILAVKVASFNTARYFNLPNQGAIAPGYQADFFLIDNFENFHIERVYKNGTAVYENGTVLPFAEPAVSDAIKARAYDTFHVPSLTAQDFEAHEPLAVIGMIAGEIVTEDRGRADGIDLEKDILKIAVVERHHGTRHIGIGYINGYGLRAGAVATSISHDSHNIIAVGANDEDLALAVNRIVENKGGIVVVNEGAVQAELVLSVAGIMSSDTLEHVNRDLQAAKEAAMALGVSSGIDPFMTLSFMSLPVIPTLRLTTRGMVDVLSQKFV